MHAYGHIPASCTQATISCSIILWSSVSKESPVLAHIYMYDLCMFCEYFDKGLANIR